MADTDDRTVLAVFSEALDVEPAARERWLADRAAGDARLAERVRRLLAADEAIEMGSGSDGAVPAAPPDRVGPYRLEALIGAGGMGSVYRAARDDGLFDQTVAIKFIRGVRGRMDLTPLIDAERRLLARMDHEGVARILDGGVTESGLHYLVMEFVAGLPIDLYAHAHGLDAAERVRLVRQAAAALAHAHQNRIVHCDVKPSNILVTDQGRAKLIDFGVARVQEAAEARVLDAATRGYASPERLERRPATLGDDVYSLAVTLYELVADRLPWSDPARPDLAEPPAPASAQSKLSYGRLPAEDLDAVLTKALSLSPDRRYRNMEEFDADLARWLERRPVKARPQTWSYVGARLLQRRPLGVFAAAGAAAGLVAALATSSILYLQAEEARRQADARFAEVRSLANFMLFELNAQLEQTPGATQTRHAMAERAQSYLDALSDSAGGDRGLKREAALGLTRLAEVQGVASRPNLGLKAEAKANLERAEGMLTELLAADPDDPRLRMERGRARYFLAVVHATLNQDPEAELAKAREAEADLLAAMQALDASGAAPHLLAEASVMLMGARLTASDALTTQNQHAAALAIREAEEARILASPLEQQLAMEFDFQAGRPAALAGDSLYYLDRKPEALAAYERAGRRFETGLARAPTHRKLMEGVIYAWWARSATLADLGRLTEALADAQKAEATAQRLAGWDPTDPLAQQNLDMASGQVTLMLQQNGRAGEALRRVEADIALRSSRLAIRPDDAELLRAAAVPLRSRGDILRDLGRKADACRAYADARDAWMGIEARGQLSEFDRTNDVARIGEALEALGCLAG
jgi:eukaryotic-like serine/threonine-protein kinase